MDAKYLQAGSNECLSTANLFKTCRFKVSGDKSINLIMPWISTKIDSPSTIMCVASTTGAHENPCPASINILILSLPAIGTHYTDRHLGKGGSAKRRSTQIFRGTTFRTNLRNRPH